MSEYVHALIEADINSKRLLMKPYGTPSRSATELAAAESSGEVFQATSAITSATPATLSRPSTVPSC